MVSKLIVYLFTKGVHFYKYNASQYEIAAELGEANNYVVLKFDNEYDWDVAVKKLGLVMEETNDANTNIRRHGLGRVIDGKSVIERFD